MSSQLDESYAVQTRNLRRVNGGASRVSRIRATKLLTTWQRGASLKLMALLPCCVTPKSDDHPWAGARTPNGITRWQDTAFVLWHHSLLQEDRFGPTTHTLSTFTMCCPLAHLPSCSQPALSPCTIAATLAGFGSAMLVSLDQPFRFPIRASAAAVDEDASPKATTTTKAAAQPRQGVV